MSGKIIDFYRYKTEHKECSRKTIERMTDIMKNARPRWIEEGEDLLVYEFRPDDGPPFEWELEGSLDNIANYILSNNFGKVFLDIETEEPLFMCIGKTLVFCSSSDYADKLREAIQENSGSFFRNKNEFLCR